MPVSDEERDEDLALLKAAAVEAAKVARRAFEKGARSWHKADASPVTEADIAVNTLLKDLLLAARPGYGWLSEESPDDTVRLKAERTFIIDPIDGTRAFVKRKQQWTISLAIVAGARPYAGAVIAPLLNDLYEAAANAGAFLNGTRLHVSQRSELENARLVGPADAFKAKPHRAPWPPIERDNFNSLAYRVCLVAAGQRDGAANVGTFHEWDIAAADLILTEAGGRLTDFHGEPLSYNKERPHCRGLIAAGPSLFPALKARLALT